VVKRILILDDEKPIVDVLTQHLQTQGYECVGVHSPGEALRLLEQNEFHLLICDVSLPEIDGNEVAEQAKKISPRLRVVMITGLGEVAFAIQAIRQGADDYVLKPFNLNEITVAVSKALDKQSEAEDSFSYQQMLEERIESATKDMERLNEELQNTKGYLENLINSTVDTILTARNDNVVEFANPGALDMFGYTESELARVKLSELFVGGKDEVAGIRARMRQGERIKNYETELRTKADNHIPVSISFSMAKRPQGGAATLVLICKDITEQRRLQHELKELSIRDSLTGLYNQRHFFERLTAEVERARRQGHALSLLLFDVDKFKYYNDTYGHLQGDNVLETIGRVILECTREHVDIGFRYGGDEFMVILTEADSDQAYSIAERMRVSFEQAPFEQLTLSMGLMTYQKDETVEEFVHFTDAMMYDAKRSGGNRVYVYKPGTEQDVLKEKDAS
jgi:diguanylate cyclase (GGDEF)-like protein/PAS domain S-box-containing protein